MYRPHPTGGTKVTDPYGVPRPGGTTHTGTDFQAPLGTPLYASQSGTVKTGTGHARAGTWVEITNGNTVIGYSHLSKRTVTNGQHVNVGDIIGYSGQTGNVTGPHLHFYVKISGKFVDPVKWLNAGTPTPPQPTPPTPPVTQEDDMQGFTVHAKVNTSGVVDDWTLGNVAIGSDLDQFTQPATAAMTRVIRDDGNGKVVSMRRGFLATNIPSVGLAWARTYAKGDGGETSRTPRDAYVDIQLALSLTSVAVDA
jgi:hypothetical protein